MSLPASELNCGANSRRDGRRKFGLQRRRSDGLCPVRSPGEVLPVPYAVRDKFENEREAWGRRSLDICFVAVVVHLERVHLRNEVRQIGTALIVALANTLRWDAVSAASGTCFDARDVTICTIERDVPDLEATTYPSTERSCPATRQMGS